ncbi:hypothetical protein ATANTOWER_021871 [Ataeniobius toweri]|uniref:Uncharacterized protein n=1 Tax=Ataeniobius toweri TaxID=208326 RepID=A0ABU7ARI3_9TELE|nr:hypothetical protein [Ataeniobius toweri]
MQTEGPLTISLCTIALDHQSPLLSSGSPTNFLSFSGDCEGHRRLCFISNLQLICIVDLMPQAPLDHGFYRGWVRLVAVHSCQMLPRSLKAGIGTVGSVVN